MPGSDHGATAGRHSAVNPALALGDLAAASLADWAAATALISGATAADDSLRGAG
jgi:hypothetical protein